MNCFDISTVQLYQIIKIILNELAMFINLSRHNFFESFNVALHEFKNIDHNIDDILNFNDEQLFLNKIIYNIV